MARIFEKDEENDNLLCIDVASRTEVRITLSSTLIAFPGDIKKIDPPDFGFINLKKGGLLKLKDLIDEAIEQMERIPEYFDPYDPIPLSEMHNLTSSSLDNDIEDEIYDDDIKRYFNDSPDNRS